MRDGDDEGVELGELAPCHEVEAVLVMRLRRARDGIVDERLDTELRELPDDVGHLAVANVGHVLLERDAEHADAGASHRDVGMDEQLHEPLSDVLAHVVVDATAGEDDLGLVAELLRLCRQVVGIDADAVTAHEAGPELEEVPLRAGGGEHVGGADAHAVEDQRELVHERDVDVALRVLDDLGGLCDLDRGRPVDAGVDDGPVGVGDAVERGVVLAGDHLGDALERVLLVARVDTLGRVAELEVLALHEAGDLREHRTAYLLGDAGVDGRLEDDDVALLEDLAHALGRADDGREIGDVVLVDRCWHRDHVECGLCEIGEVARDL